MQSESKSVIHRDSDGEVIEMIDEVVIITNEGGPNDRSPAETSESTTLPEKGDKAFL